MLLETGSQSKNVSCIAWIWPNSDRRLVNDCALPSVGQTWDLASIGAVFEMGVLIRTLKRLLTESVHGLALERTWPKSYSIDRPFPDSETRQFDGYFMLLRQTTVFLVITN
jgi:hypothetical protein